MDGNPVGRLTSLSQDAVTFHEVTLLGPDGGLVHVVGWNATDVKPGPATPPSAEEPPLTLEELRTLAESPAWTDWTP